MPYSAPKRALQRLASGADAQLELNGLEGASTAQWRAFAGLLAHNSVVTSLILEHNEIGAEGAKHIADALKENSTLTTLDMKGTQIGDEGAKHIADALKENSTLTTLSLELNEILEIGAEGAKHIADALKENSTLTTLDLWNNKIGAEGTKHIADALKANSTLTTLHLTSNEIGDDGAKHIADALKENSTLTTLELGCNEIGAEGAKHIADALKENSTLTTLDTFGGVINRESDADEALRLRFLRAWWTRGVVHADTVDGTWCGAWIDAVTWEATAPASASRAGGYDARAEARIAIEYACRHHHAHAAVMASDTLQAYVTEEDVWAACTRAIAPAGARWAAVTGVGADASVGAGRAGTGDARPLWFPGVTPGMRAALRSEAGVDDVRGAYELCCLDAAWLTDAALLQLARHNPEVSRLALCGAARVTADGLEAAAARWPGLRHLALAEMPALRSLPRRLHALATLHVRDVGLSALPPEVVKVETHPPHDAYGRTAWAKKVDARDSRVLRYLQAIDADGTLPCPLAKIALVGYAFEGKTTLLQALMHATAGGGFPRDVRALPSAYHRTVGIDVQQWRVPDADRPLLATVYDFAGQEAYYATHALFLSARSLFVLVVNLYDWGEGRPRRLFGWLESVRARCPEAVVAIVGTHLDLVGPEAAESRLKDAFRIVRDWREETGATLRLGGLCAVDPVKGDAVSLNAEDPWASPSCHERGADGARLAIRVLQSSLALLEHVGEQVAASRVRLATLAFDHTLASGPQPFLSVAALRAALQKAGFQESMLAPDQVADSIRFAHDLGVLSWFGQYGASVRDLVFVDPAWLGARLSEVVFHVPFDLRVVVRPLPGEDQFGVTVEARCARVRSGEWHVLSPLAAHTWEQFSRLHVSLGSPSSVASPDARMRASGEGASAAVAQRSLRERLGLLWDRARESASDRATHLEAYVNEIVACEELGNHNVQLLEFLGLPGAEVDVQRAFVAAGMAHRDTDPAAARARDRHPALVDKYVTTGVLPRTLLEDVWSASSVPAELLDPLARVLCGVRIMCPMGATDAMGRGRGEARSSRRRVRHADDSADDDTGVDAGAEAEPDAVARATQFLVPAMLPPAEAFPFRAGSRWRLRGGDGDGDGPVLRRRVTMGRRVPDGLFGELLVTLRRQCDASYGDLEMTQWSQQHVVLRAPADGATAVVVVSHVDEEQPQTDAGGRGGVFRDTARMVRPLNAALPGASASGHTALDVVGTGSPRHRLFARALGAVRECGRRCSRDAVLESVPLVGPGEFRLIPLREVVERAHRGDACTPPGGPSQDAATLVLAEECQGVGAREGAVPAPRTHTAASGAGALHAGAAPAAPHPPRPPARDAPVPGGTAGAAGMDSAGRAPASAGAGSADTVLGLAARADGGGGVGATGADPLRLREAKVRNWVRVARALVVFGVPLCALVGDALRALHSRLAAMPHHLVCAAVSAAADALRAADRAVGEAVEKFERAAASSDAARREAAGKAKGAAKSRQKQAARALDALQSKTGSACKVCDACVAVAGCHGKSPQWSNSVTGLWQSEWSAFGKLFLAKGFGGSNMRRLDAASCITSIEMCTAGEFSALRDGAVLPLLRAVRDVRNPTLHDGLGHVSDDDVGPRLAAIRAAAEALSLDSSVLEELAQVEGYTAVEVATADGLDAAVQCGRAWFDNAKVLLERIDARTSDIHDATTRVVLVVHVLREGRDTVVKHVALQSTMSAESAWDALCSQCGVPRGSTLWWAHTQHTGNPAHLPAGSAVDLHAADAVHADAEPVPASTPGGSGRGTQAGHTVAQHPDAGSRLGADEHKGSEP